MVKKSYFSIFLLAGLLILSPASLGGCSGGSKADNAAVAARQETAAAEETGADLSSVSDTDTGKDINPDSDAAADMPAIVWLGDSLTQGSLGDDNHNKDNPQAPWRVLADISGWTVEGYGYYGYNTDDIFWRFGEDGGEKDPSKIYVFWVGSNDFYASPDNIGKVIEEIDGFMERGGLDKYLILGTTNRGDMDPDAYKEINRRFAEVYGNNYLDILPVEYGYDGVHLTEASYRSVAEAVYDKLRELYGN